MFDIEALAPFQQVLHNVDTRWREFQFPHQEDSWVAQDLSQTAK